MASAALEVISIVELCVKYGGLVKQFISDVKNSKEDQDEILLSLTSDLKVIDLHKSMLEKLSKESREAVRERMDNMAASARELLFLADQLKRNPHGSFEWASRKKKKVHQTVKDILQAQSILEDRLTLLAVYQLLPLAGSGSGDTARIISFIEQSLLRRQNGQGGPKDLELASIPSDRIPQTLPGSEFLTAPSLNGGGPLIVEEYSWLSKIDRERVFSRVQKVALTFHAPTPDARNFQARKAKIAQCVGYVKGVKSATIIFELPGDIEKLQSLRQVLTAQRRSLNARLELARSLSTAVFFTHAYKYVHKNIRSSIVLVGERRPSRHGRTAQSAFDSMQVFLAGFAGSRAEADISSRRATNPQPNDLYQHPSRVGQDIPTAYTFLHDIYSLGVCLLEIGLWTDFVDPGWSELQQANPHAREKMLKEYAEEYLPSEMGTAYRDIVLDCLGGFEGAFVDAIDHSADGSELGLRYIEIVLDGLDGIKV